MVVKPVCVLDRFVSSFSCCRWSQNHFDSCEKVVRKVGSEMVCYSLAALTMDWIEERI